MEGWALQDGLCAVIRPILSLARQLYCARMHHTPLQCLDMCFNAVKTTPLTVCILNAKSRGACVMRAIARSRFISNRLPSLLTKRHNETDCYYGNITQYHLASSVGTWEGETDDNHRWTYRKDWFTQSVQSCFCTSPPEAWLQVDYIFLLRKSQTVFFSTFTYVIKEV